MAVTPIELFRAGKPAGPRFERLRPGEVAIQSQNGVDWVVGRSGGASTLEAPTGIRGTWWRLPAGTAYDDKILYLWRDYSPHWAWEPIRDMPLADYVNALNALNVKFIRV